MIRIRRSQKSKDSRIIGLVEEIEELSMMDPHKMMDGDIWYAEVDDEVAGGAVVAPDAGDHGVRLRRIGVRHQYRGQGIGRALVERLYGEYGVLEVHCQIGTAANEFYRSTGWEAVETDVPLNKYVYRG